MELEPHGGSAMQLSNSCLLSFRRLSGGQNRAGLRRSELTLHMAAVAAIFLFLCANGLAQSSQKTEWGQNDAALDKRVDSILRQMTTEEKIGQLVQYSAGQPTGPGTGRSDYDDMVQKGQLGALFNITTAREANAFQRVAMEKSRLHIPLVFGLDVIHGYRTEFPIPLGLAS